MPTFRYVAKDKTGKIHRGNVEAADENSLESQLREAGYWLVQADVDRGRNPVTQGQPSITDTHSVSQQKGQTAFILIGLGLIAIALWLWMILR